MAETIIQRNVVDVYLEDMQKYAIAVNRKQNVPFVQDGLKTVNRRILIDMMLKEGLRHDKPYSKCAGVVGTTLKFYHPHGDSSVYEALVLMANWWDIKMPLIDGHGNYGNIQGKDAAAYRYTECRLSEFADDCVLGDLYKSLDIIDWKNNYNDRDREPEYLPVKVPLLLVNGAFGIGVGTKCDIPTHNLAEVIDATIAVINDPNAPVVLIPDHCSPCEIVDTNWKQISNTGFGNYRVRAIIDIEWNKDTPLLVIKGIPNKVTLLRTKGSSDEGVIAKINEMVKSGALPMISDVYSDSRGDNLRYVIQLKKGSDPNFVKDYLYKHTALESAFRVNFEVVDGLNFPRFSYKSYIQYFIEFSITLKIRSYAALYAEAKTKWRTLQLYIMVMESGEIEGIQSEIRKMKDVSVEARNKFKEKIIKRFNVSDIEAEFIMNMDIMKTAPGYLPIYKQQSAELEAKFEEYFYKMTNEDVLKKEIADELLLYKKKYGTPRICRVVKDHGETIPGGTFKIVVTENNYIKKISPNDPINAYRGDKPKFTLTVDNAESVLLFDKNGKVFKLPVHKVALCDKNSSGVDLRLLIKNCTSDIVSLMYEPAVEEFSKKTKKYFLTVVTEGGSIKKMDLDDFFNIPPSGILYTKLAEGDFVKDITIISDDLDIILYSDKKALRFNMSEVPHYKRNALGVAGMNSDHIDGLSVIYPNATDIVVITVGGKVNRFTIEGLKSSGRNKAGSSVIKLGKTDSIHSIYGVNESNTIRIVSKDGSSNIKVSEIPVGSSISPGSKVCDVVFSTHVF